MIRPLAAAALLLPAVALAQPRTEAAIGPNVWARPLTAHAWLVRSVSPLPGFGDVASNAVLLAGEREAVLVDTPATDAQTVAVLAWAERTLHRPVRHLLVTHWHADRMGGIRAALARRVATYAHERTRALAREHGLPVPEHPLRVEERLTLAGLPIATFYPGPGHTPDNIVVWAPGDALLVGGCVVREASATSLGNTAEADPRAGRSGSGRCGAGTPARAWWCRAMARPAAPTCWSTPRRWRSRPRRRGEAQPPPRTRRFSGV